MDFWTRLFDSSDFCPRHLSGGWTEGLIWLHIASDVLIWLASLAIPALLIYLVHRRKDVPFPRMVWLFGLFLVSCGLTHLLEVVLFATPVYRVSGLVKLVAAGASWATLLTLLPLVPRLLRLRSPEELQREITERKKVEQELRLQTAHLEAIIATQQAIRRTDLDPDAVMNLVAERSQQLAGAEGAAIGLVEDNELLFRAATGCAERCMSLRLGLGSSLSGQCVKAGLALRCDDAETDDRVDREVCRKANVRSLVVVPLHHEGRIVGVLQVLSSQPHAFGERHLHSLQLMAGVLGAALGHAAEFAAKRAAEQEVRQLNENLERRVRERTAQWEAANEELQQANRLKDEFLATVSHELRTPLNAMTGWVHLLRSGKLDAATVSRGLQVLERNVKAQAQLIEDLLDVSRIISGKLRLNVQEVELAAVIEAAVEAVRPAADAKEITLEADLDAGAGPVSGDPGRLQQVVWNLLSNAVKFTPQGGHVEVRLERAGSHVEVTVRDNGQGISPDFLPFVFERFRQADGGTTRVQGGLGLGLAIVRHLVELHGGLVRAESPGEEEGATFTVCLPILAVRKRPAADPARESVPARQPMAEVGGLRVLVVDDEADARELLTVVLSESGAEVIAVASAAEALAAIKQLRPDVLVSDIGMPGEDGYSLIRKVRALQPGCGGRVPAVALTAYARSEDRTRALAAGFQQHAPKPIEPAELTAVVQSLAAWADRD